MVASQIRGDYQTKDLVLSKYLQCTLRMTQNFLTFEVLHVPREENARANLLARLANTKGSGLYRMVIQERIETRSFEIGEVLDLISREGWKDPIIRHLTQDLLPEDEMEAHKIKRKATRFLMVAD